MIRILTGEPFQVERAYLKLRGSLLNPSLQEFNLDRLEGKETTASRLLECCRLLPVLAQHRLVVVREADEIRKAELERLEPHLAELSKNATLILLAEKVDRRLSFWKKISVLAQWDEFRPLYPRELPGWIREEVRFAGKKIDAAAVDWMVTRIGTELGLIASSLQKALLFIGPKESIAVGDLEATVGLFSWQNLFAMTDAIGSKETDRAFRLFRLISLSGESHVGLLALIARHFRILMKVKETGQGAPPYFLKNYQQQASRFSNPTLRSGIEKIFRADWELKSSPIPSEILMERLILDLCQ